MPKSANNKAPTPGRLLHKAIAQNDWPAAELILKKYKAEAGATKNATGSTPLMLAANGKCGKNNAKLIEALLTNGNGGQQSAAERNPKGKTAADIAEELGKVELANRLRTLEQSALSNEKFQRCPRCMAKLKRRSQLAYVKDCVMKGEEKNELILELFNEHPLAVERLDVPALHRVNCCLSFRKELTESLALVSEIKKLRRQAEDSSCEDASSSSSSSSYSWKGWHLVDLCSGAQCMTAALCLSILPGVSFTALDIVPSKELPHFEDVEWTTMSDIGGKVPMSTTKCNADSNNDMTSSFSYLQRDVHDKDLAVQLRSHISNGNATYTGEKVIVLAMHCCGALSQRAVKLFEELDAASVLIMPCCLPPKVLGWSKKSKTFDPSLASTSWNPCNASNSEENMRDDAEVKAMAEIFATTDQDEQYQRWGAYLCQYTLDIAAGDNGNSVTTCKITSGEGVQNANVAAKLKEVDAVLSSRNTLITATRNGSALSPQLSVCEST